MDSAEKTITALSDASGARALRRMMRSSQLIEAALECIGTLGIRETTVQDVAARADMAVGSISQYFDSKEALFTAVLRTLAEEFEATWLARATGEAMDPALRLRRFVECYFAPAICQRKKMAVWFAFWGEVKARPQYRDVCAGYDRAHDRMLEELCTALAADAAPAVADPRHAAKIVASVCHGLWLELLTGTDGLRRAELESLALQQLATLYPRQAHRFLDAPGAE